MDVKSYCFFLRLVNQADKNLPGDFGFFDNIPAHEARMACEGVRKCWDAVKRPYPVPSAVASLDSADERVPQR